MSLDLLELVRQTLNDEAKCYVCMEHSSREIYQCRNGHILCHKCETKMATCGICRSGLRLGGKSRNIVLEKVMNLVKFKCRNAEVGCQEQLSRDELSDHESTCNYNRNVVRPNPVDEENAKKKSMTEKRKRHRNSRRPRILENRKQMKAKELQEKKKEENTGNSGPMRTPMRRSTRSCSKSITL